MKILIISNARRKGGLSGSDAIYESFKKYWPEGCKIEEHNQIEIDFKPFWLCYLIRIIKSCIVAYNNISKYDLVYSSSDFLMDSLPGFIYKLKGRKWVAGFYLEAPKDKKIYYYTQKIAYYLIKKYADIVIVTNPSMYPLFYNKKKAWINGGVDFTLAEYSNQPKIYDLVFCGRIHFTKGIVNLLRAWEIIIKEKPNAKLAIIGDGDLGKEFIKNYIDIEKNNITLFGYMGNERYNIYKQSKIVSYPTPVQYSHFSMAPVEAMACGCPMVAFDLPVFNVMNPLGAIYKFETINEYAEAILYLLENDKVYKKLSIDAHKWSKQFSYNLQSQRIFQFIKKELAL